MPYSGIFQCKWYSYPVEIFQIENQLYSLENIAEWKLEYFALDNKYLRLDNILPVFAPVTYTHNTSSISLSTCTYSQF